jgi:GTPase SAR1 family protein
VTRIFYRGAHCVFLTYDITRDETFVSVVEWLKEIKQHASEDVCIYLVGNKAEMEEEREITFDRAIEFAKTHGIHKCFETSAKTGLSVEDLFSCAGKNLFNQTMQQ